MSAEHRWPLVAFLVLSALCLAVAVAGLGATATRLPGMPGTTLLASGAPAHLEGRVLVGRTSAVIPVGNDRPVVPPTVALPASAPESVNAPAVGAAVSEAVVTSPVSHRTPHHARHHAVRHHAVRHQAGRRAVHHRTHAPRRWSAPGLRHAAHRAAPHRVASARVPARRISPQHPVVKSHGRHRGWQLHGHRGHRGHPRHR